MKNDVNLYKNNNLDYDEHIEEAYKLCNLNFSHAELISMLKNGNIAKKQIAALKFDYVQSYEDAEALIFNLTGCDGKIREAVAQKISALLRTQHNTKQFFAEISANKFADATVDINANICRLIIDSAIILREYEKFSVQYTSLINKYTEEALNELDKFIFKDKKYLINKQIFKLYWCLEAIKYFQGYIDADRLEFILTKCSVQSEYTIREKTAQIVSISNKFPTICKKLKNDDNYYVREAFKSSMLL